MFEENVIDDEAIWLIGVYVKSVWKYVICKKKGLNLETLKSEYQLKNIVNQESNMPDLGYIAGLQD